MISEVCSTSLANLALHSSCAVPFDAVELRVNYLSMSTVIELKGVLPERKWSIRLGNLQVRTCPEEYYQILEAGSRRDSCASCGALFEDDNLCQVGTDEPYISSNLSTFDSCRVQEGLLTLCNAPEGEWRAAGARSY